MAVNDSRTANILLEEVSGWAVHKGIFKKVPSLPVNLAGPSDIEQGDLLQTNTLGITRKVVTTTARSQYVKAESITMATGLPSPIFQMVAAHELGHVWVANNGIVNLGQQDEEGFCELIAHMWVAERGNLGQAGLLKSIETSQDPIYGDGFRKMYRLKERIGLPGVIKSMARRSGLRLFER